MDHLARSTRIQLKPLSWNHFYTHYAWANDDELQRLEHGAVLPREPVYQFIGRFERMMQQDTATTQHLQVHTGNSTIIGVAKVLRESQTEASIELTICEAAYRGKGLGRAAFELLLQYCFETLEVDRISATSRPCQHAWIHLLQSSGFSRRQPGTAGVEEMDRWLMPEHAYAHRSAQRTAGRAAA